MNDSNDEDVPTWALYIFTVLAVMGVIFMLIVIVAIIRGQLNPGEGRFNVRVTPNNGVEQEIIDKYMPVKLFN